jgi:hypothetical protein
VCKNLNVAHYSNIEKVINMKLWLPALYLYICIQLILTWIIFFLKKTWIISSQKLFLFPIFNLKEASKMKQDDGDFVYCLPRNRVNKRSRYDPYDLQVVSPNESRSEKVYWTVSASFVTRVSLFGLVLWFTNTIKVITEIRLRNSKEDLAYLMWYKL